MKLGFDPDERSPRKWHAITDDGGYDASGVTPIDTLAELVEVLERALAEKDSR